MPKKQSTTSAVSNVAQKKKVRRRKRTDGKFTGKTKRTGASLTSSNSHLNRAATETEFLDVKTGQKIPLKSAAVYNYRAITFHDANMQDNWLTFTDKLRTEQENIPSNRPIQETVMLNGQLVGAFTPGRTYLEIHGNVGAVACFSNQPISPFKGVIKDKLPADSTFTTTEEYKSIKEFFNDIKIAKTEVSKKQLSKTHAAKKASRSQFQVMHVDGKNSSEASATRYTEKTGMFTNLKWEWLHLIAYMILGEDAQKSNNLAAGTNHANTEMLFVENQLKSLCKHYPNGYNIAVKAKMIENTNIATIIDYTISTDDFTLDFSFNAQNHKQPHKVFGDYIKVLFVAVLDFKTEMKAAAKMKKTPTVAFAAQFPVLSLSPSKYFQVGAMMEQLLISPPQPVASPQATPTKTVSTSPFSLLAKPNEKKKPITRISKSSRKLY